jgi:uncharacterized protein
VTNDHERPLSEEDIDELDELLAQIPDERDPLDVAMLDGYLVAVLLQPDVVPPSAWLPLVFDAEGGAEPPAKDAATARATALIMRRYNELAAYIAAREPFDPIIFEFEDESGKTLTGKAGIVALAPWVGGFVNALNAFPALADAADDDDEIGSLLSAILRHLPVDPDAPQEERDAFAREQAELDLESPLGDLDEAIDELVGCALDIAEITRPNRPLTRDTPKVGRNDPCPCGSGRKYKACHGADAD